MIWGSINPSFRSHEAILSDALGTTPCGMGASVFAPEDEYDDPASSLVGASRKAEDLDELVQGRYPTGNPQMLSAIVSAIELFLQANESPSAES